MMMILLLSKANNDSSHKIQVVSNIASGDQVCVKVERFSQS